MMKAYLFLGSFSLLMTGTALADTVGIVGSGSAAEQSIEAGALEQQANAAMKSLSEYLLNLGAYLGFNLKQAPPGGTNTSNSLLDVASTQLLENYTFNTVLGAIPVDAINTALMQFVPNNLKSYSAINSFANYTFTNPPYSNAGAQGTVTANPLVDQKSYQPDPVSQAILNILGTPDYTFCMANNGTTPLPNCELLYQYQIMNNVIGKIPNTEQFFSYDYNHQFLSQLNANNLISPLMYSTQSGGASTSSSPTTTGEQGLTATSQAQQAANFIRYAISSVFPLTLASHQQYDAVYSVLVTKPKTTEQQAQYNLAQTKLLTYLTQLRVYAAQMSVAIGNLYYIFSKRMPQNQSASGANMNSQALSEFTMATWRLYNPDQSANKQWINQINTASSSTVQKEMATLLAEINYQLYLTRQQNERILLTNTLILLQNSHGSQPSAESLNMSTSNQ